jgi:toxin ParE1/3/4
VAHRVAPQAEADLDDIWPYTAKECGSIDVATRLIDAIASRFISLARFPYLGQAAMKISEPGRAAPPWWEYFIIYCVDGQEVLILRVVHGRRDLEALFGK